MHDGYDGDATGFHCSVLLPGGEERYASLSISLKFLAVFRAIEMGLTY